MRLQIVDIGNSKGIRLPQTLLKQVNFGEEVDVEVNEGRLTLKRTIDASMVPEFSAMADLDDLSIQRTLRKITGKDLVAALVGAGKPVKEAIYRNLSPRVKSYVEPTVARLEAGDARDLLIEMARNSVSEAMMEVLRD